MHSFQEIFAIIGVIAICWIAYRIILFTWHLTREAIRAKNEFFDKIQNSEEIPTEIPTEIPAVETKVFEENHATLSDKPFAKLGGNVLDKNFYPDIYKDVEKKEEIVKRTKNYVSKIVKKVVNENLNDVSEITLKLQNLLREKYENGIVKINHDDEEQFFINFLIPIEEFEEPIVITTFVKKNDSGDTI